MQVQLKMDVLVTEWVSLAVATRQCDDYCLVQQYLFKFSLDYVQELNILRLHKL